MNTLRGLFAGCMVATMLSFAAPSTAEAGCFGLLVVAAHQLTAASLASLPGRRDLVRQRPMHRCT